MGFKNYTGSMKFGSGLIPKSEGYPLMQTCDIQADEEGTRLDVYLANLKLSGGANGSDGNDGADGITPQLKLENGELFVSYNEGYTWSLLGNIQGANGNDGKSIANATVNASGQLVLTLSDDTAIIAGNVVGEKGKDGTGVNILGSCNSSSQLPSANNTKGDGYLINGHLYIWDGEDWVDGGNIQGPKGADGVSITGASINAEGQLLLTLSSGETLTVGKVVGANGEDGEDGEDGVGIASIEQTIFSSADDGNNEFTVTLTNGNTASFVVKNGSKGSDGEDGNDGEDGEDGADGKSAYELAKDAGYDGTLDEWLASLVGKNGTNGITPKFRIEGVNLEVSYDDEKTWTSLGTVQGSGGSGGEWQFSAEEAAYLKQLYDDSQYEALSGSLSMTPTTTQYEMKNESISVKFSWSFNKKPTNVIFNNVAQTPAESGSTTIAVARNVHGSKTYKLVATYTNDNTGKTDPTVALQKTIEVYNKYYWGCAALPDYAKHLYNETPTGSYTEKELEQLLSNFIKGLAQTGDSKYAKTKEITFTPNRIEGAYIWYAYPSMLGKATMYTKIGDGGFEEPITVPVTNNSGYKEDYYVYRSTESGVSAEIGAK